ncbi:MAG: hypothetical protein OSA41_11550 [Erythrobacter sp.]|uniref:hypothetical protein n=1 Tax=Qipengyuania citrea TaxID=225971 RepID=UPI00209DA731|nr:protein TonB [Qipengyuania citrea]MDE0902337.1 hypothetical protein [Erythrobacter sp.]
MTEPASPIAGLRQRYDDLPPEWRQRIPALALALAVEILLVLVLLSLGSVKREVVAMTDTLVAFTTSSQDEEEAVADAPTPAEVPEAAQPQVSQTQPEDAAAEPRPQVTPPLPVPRPVLRNDFSLERVPQQAPPAPAEKPQAYGPPDTSSPGDTPRIAGSGPNGEPLYAARWYRRPYDDELAGYLSTAQGPGWGLIDCRTVPDFRVEDCVVVGESPQGSGIAQAVLAAAWQFKVRPPQRGGRPMVGEWVRIRISYEIDPGEAARRRLRN